MKQLKDDADAAHIPIEFRDVPLHAERIMGKVLAWRREEAPAPDTYQRARTPRASTWTKGPWTGFLR